MTNLEKVIKGLECCLNTSRFVECTENCPYYQRKLVVGVCSENLMRDALSLLKGQEPKPVGLYGKDDWYGLVCVCPDCKAEWMSDESNTHFCPNCGQAVKWDG